MNKLPEQRVGTLNLSELKQLIKTAVVEATGKDATRTFLTPDQVAEVLQIEARNVREMCLRGELKSYKVGKFIRIERKDLDTYLNECDRSR
jgi:excisionase family DNA binding protein